MYRDGWMEALATDKVRKQGEHIPPHCYISRSHIAAVNIAN